MTESSSPSHWVSTGSRTTGSGYSAEIMTNHVALGMSSPAYGVRLWWDGLTRVEKVASFTDAQELRVRFCSMAHAWKGSR